ncbi:MAG: ACT domain-containing protein [Bacteroidota bacterium]
MSLLLDEWDGRFAVSRFDPDDDASVRRLLALVRSTESFWSLTRTPDEVSLICPEFCVPDDIAAEQDWVLFRVQGTLDFEATGIAARLTAPLAEAGVSVLIVATHDTDYALVKADRRDEAICAWASAQVDVNAATPS